MLPNYSLKRTAAG